MAEAQIITSRYVRIDQTPAGVGERIFARILDYLILFVYTVGMIYLIDSMKLYLLFEGSGELWVFV
ncbi:MAG: RDD family protein, partial [Tannerella sp.]|nr:RDD family protein [Tannerella sp.]